MALILKFILLNIFSVIIVVNGHSVEKRQAEEFLVIIRFASAQSGLIMDSRAAEHIQSSILENVYSIPQGEKMPFFDYSTLSKQRNWFEIHCSDPESVNWLLGLNIPPFKDSRNQTQSWEILRYIDLMNPTLVPVMAEFPNPRLSERQILYRLSFQNPALSTDRWRVAKTVKGTQGQTLTFQIDPQSMNVLKNLSWQPHFEIGRVRFWRVSN